MKTIIYVQDKLQKYGNNLIFKLNLTDKDIHIIFKNKSFKKDIISAWSNINLRFQEHGRNNRNSYKTMLWYNSDIRIDKQPVFLKSVYENGIKHINQLYDFRSKSFYTFEDF